jgi:hypothetical protein
VILDSLAVIANDWRWLAIAWHALFIAALIATWWRRPITRTVATLMIAPAISVSALAWWSDNPFTGTLFAGLALLMAIVARRFQSSLMVAGPSPDAAAGVVLATFGLVYPHFLRAESWVEYVYAAPFGLVPCPTLLVLVGVSLLAGSFGSRRWAATIAGTSLVYGVIGVAVLGVWLDAVLIAGAIVLAGRAWRPGVASREELRPRHRRTHPETLAVAPKYFASVLAQVANLSPFRTVRA